MSQSTVSLQSSAARDVAQTVNFLQKLVPEPRSFAVRLWDGTQLEANIGSNFTLVLNCPGALRQMFRPPLELSLCEAFIRGKFDIEGDIFAAFNLFNSLAANVSNNLLTLIRLWLSLPKDPTPARTITRDQAHLSGARHTRERDRAAIQYHYDVGNDFYALWLDKRMVYSCAYFPTGTEDIDAAQEEKLELICRKLKLQPGETLLDIGCGWGGLIIYAAQKYGVNALGVTLSKEQYLLANQRIAAANLDGTAVKLLDYRDITGRTFDKIVSVGMFEHVGRAHLPEYFAHVYRVLKPGGLFLNHGISLHPHPPQTEPHRGWIHRVKNLVLGSGTFIQRYIFPDGELVPVSEVNLIAEKTGFEARHLENLREHYALTLRHWIRRLEDQRTEAIQLTDETTYRTWKLYMSASVYGFEAGNLNINQTLLLKPHNSHNRISLLDSRH